jgi:hypothetical protein
MATAESFALIIPSLLALLRSGSSMARPMQVGDDVGAGWGVVLADTTGKYDCVKTAQRGDQRAQFAHDAIDKKRIASLAAGSDEEPRARMSERYPGHPEQVGSLVDDILDSCGVHAVMLHHMEDDAGIDCAAARSHQ